VSYDSGSNILQVEIEADEDPNETSIRVSIRPDILMIKLLKIFVEINDRDLSTSACGKKYETEHE